MNRRFLALGLLIVTTAACGGAEPISDTPPAPPQQAPEPPPAQPATTPAAVEPAAPAADTAKPVEAPPAPKSAKERAQGKWTGALAGEARTKAEEAAKKKAGKDEAKAAELLKKDEDKLAQETLEITPDGMIVLSTGDKATSKVKYEVVSENGPTLVIKLVGKDEITKKDAPKDEVTITLGDSTLEWKTAKATKHFKK